MDAVVSVSPEDDLRTATALMVDRHLREVPVVDADGRVIGTLDEAEVAKVYLRAAARAEDTMEPAPRRP